MDEAIDDGAMRAADEQLVADELRVADRAADAIDADPEQERRRMLAERLGGNSLETRRFDLADIELRETSDGMLRFSGYASVTEHGYEVGDFKETIARGAFKRTLSQNPDVVLLVNHEGMPLARTKSGTMTLSEDSRGYRVDADLNPEDPDVRGLLPKMQRGDIDQMSFAFRVTDQEWNNDYSERLIRSLDVHRGDVSIVTMGANPATTSTIAMRSADGGVEIEFRAGKALSAANQSELQSVLDKIASADVALDAAQPQLAAVLGVDNPDAADAPPKRIHVPNHTERARQEYDLLVARSAA